MIENPEIVSVNQGKYKRRKSVVLVIVAIIGILFLSVYATSFGNKPFSTVASLLPFPALRVNGSIIFYRSAFKKYDGVKHAYGIVDDGLIEDTEFRERIFESLIRERLVRQLMKEHGVFVKDSDVAQLMQDLQDQVGSRDDFKKQVKENYGWRLRVFEKQVAKPFVEAQSLEDTLLSDRDLQNEKRSLVDEAYSKIQKGSHFDGMVLEYSEDATKIFNGDFGWMSESEMPEAWRAPALHLEAGDVSPVLEERNRFVILRVDDREEGDEDLKTQTRVNLSAIIVNKISLTDVIEELAEDSKIKVWVKI